jgi:methyl-accepting chemotaxis protein
MLANMTTRAKLALLIGLALAGLAVVGAIALLQGRRAEEAQTRLVDRDVPLLIDLNTLYAAGLQSGQATRNMLLNPADKTAESNYQAAHEQFEKARASALEAAPPHMQDRLRKIGALWGEDHALKLEVQRLARAGRSPEAVEVLVRRETPKWRDVRTLLLELLAAQRSAFAAGKEVEIRSIERSRWWLVVAVLLSGAALFVLATGLARSISLTIRRLLAETGRLTSAAQEGRLDERGDAAIVGPEFRPVVEGMNATMDAFVKPIRLSGEHLARVARGDLPPPIADHSQGDFRRIEDAVNACIAAVSGLIGEMTRMSAAHEAGDIDARVEAGSFEGAWRTMAAGVNGMVDAHIEVKRKAMGVFAEFGKGNFGATLEQLPGKRRFVNDAVEQVRRNLKRLIVELNRVSAEHDAGDVDAIIDVQGFEGEFRTMADGVNRMVAGLVAMDRKAMGVVREFGKGNFEAPLERFPGKKAVLNGTVEQVRSNLKALIVDVNGLAEAAVAGQLATRADAAKHEGDFRRIVEGVNRTLDAVLAPVNEAAAVLEKLSRRDLRARVGGEYRGDHAKLAQSVNATAEALHGALAQVSEVVEQVSSAASQIASSSQAVASGASEQAASLAETSAAVDSVAGTTRQSADSAQRANQFAQAARAAATEGASSVDQMQAAMGRMKASAEGTSVIIKDINDIAFQTNLLALNAAVEAARAGEAGRGFAVVAEEVRSLALRAKEAATRTEELIRQSVKEAGEGEATGKRVAGKLGDIVEGVGKVTAIVSEIAAAAREQAAGIEQVNRAVTEMDKVTQQNAASAEESSSAASELAGQSQELASMVSTFQIDRRERRSLADHRPRVAEARAPADAAGASSRAGGVPVGVAERTLPKPGGGRLLDF